jgi:hypothetical protein
MDDLRSRLRDAADSHRPDRERMLARVERGMARPSPGRSGRHRERTAVLSWPRVVLATLATAGAMTVGGFAVGAIVHGGPQPGRSAVAAPGGSAPPASATASGPASPAATRSPGPSGSPARSGTARPSAEASDPAGRSSAPPTGAHGRTSDGPLWSDGSVDPHSTDAWAQSNVTVKARTPLTALTVELRIALTAGVADTGHWQTLPTADVDVSVRKDGGFLVYRWTLKAGRTVPAGQIVFAGQYDHATGGRDAQDDTYRADATAAAGPAAVWGDFARTS